MARPGLPADLYRIRLVREGEMAAARQDPLTALSDAIAARAETACGSVVAVRTGRHASSGTLWRGDVVIASAQAFPKTAEAEIACADGSTVAARVAGRDPGTNILALRLDQPVEC